MEALNLLDNKPHNVFKHDSVLYIKTTSKACPYMILEPCNVIEADIQYGMRYSYYKIGERLYDSFLTNDYKCFVGKIETTAQLRLF